MHSAIPPEARPSRSDFLELAGSYDLVPVVQELTSDTVTPFVVWSRLAVAGRNPFAPDKAALASMPDRPANRDCA